MPKITSRLLLSMLYLGMLLFGGGYVLQWAQSFEGIIVVEKGRTEQWTVHSSDEGGNLFSTHRNMPMDVIGFDNKRAATKILNPKEQYDAAILPFRLKLDAVKVLEELPDKETLEVIQAGKTTSAKVIPGQSLSLPEGQVTMVGVEPWRGLVRDGSGTPMATISLKSGKEKWSPAVFVDTTSVARPVPGLAVSLHWFPKEEDARTPVPANELQINSTRWGIHDTGRTHWFDTLTPGTGVTTSDGAKYVLTDVVSGKDASQPPVAAIVLDRTTNGKTTQLRITANADTPDSEAVLESFNDAVVLRLHAWRDGSVVPHLFIQGKQQETELLNEGDVLEIMGADKPLQLRLEQVMHHALPIMNEEVRMLVVQTPKGELHIREGQTAHLKESHLRFRSLPQPPTVQYTLKTIPQEKEKDGQEFVLAPNASKRIGQWRFTNDVEHPDNATIAVLHVKRLPGTPTQYFGLALFLIGALGLTVFRFAGWHSYSHKDAGTIFEEDKWTAVPPEENDPNFHG